MEIDEKTRQRQCFWIYETAEGKYRIYVRTGDGPSQAAVDCDTRAKAEEYLSTPEKRALVKTFM